jgi:hypothetical protein
MHDFVVGANAGIGYIFVVELNRIGETFAFGLFDMAVMHAVVLWRCVEIPSVE